MQISGVGKGLIKYVIQSRTAYGFTALHITADRGPAPGPEVLVVTTCKFLAVCHVSQINNINNHHDQSAVWLRELSYTAVQFRTTFSLITHLPTALQRPLAQPTAPDLCPDHSETRKKHDQARTRAHARATLSPLDDSRQHGFPRWRLRALSPATASGALMWCARR